MHDMLEGGANMPENTISFSRKVTFTTAGALFIEEVRESLGANPLRPCSGVLEIDFFNKEKGYYVEPFDGFQNADADTPEQDDLTSETDHQRNAIREERISEREYQKQQFEETLDKFSTVGFLIHGQPGTGKSTYAHKLAHERRKACDFHFLDLGSYVPALQLNGERIDLSDKIGIGEIHSEKTLWKIVSIALSRVFFMLRKPNTTDGTYYLMDRVDGTSYRERLKLITDKYKEIFLLQEDWADWNDIDPEKMEKLFNCFNNTTERDMATCFIKELNEYFGNHSEKESLSLVIQFLFRLYCCLYELDNQKRHYVCVFDDLEHIIRHFDESDETDESDENDENGTIKGYVNINDLKRFLEIFTSIYTSTVKLLSCAKQRRGWNEYPCCFLIVARESSLTLEDIREVTPGSDEAIKDIEISGWFCPDKIFENRLNNRPNITNKSTEGYWKAFRFILQDISISDWSLYDVLAQMYNFSIRRIARMLRRILARMSEEDIRYFNDKWEYAFNNELYSNKYICRQYIFSLLLREIKDKHIFSLESNHKQLAWRTILYLHNRSFLDGLEHVTFSELVKAVINKTDNASDNEIENLIDILYWLHERRWNVNHWAALVDIEDGEAHAYHKNDFRRKLIGDRFRISITEAGQFFALFIADFEYCARRSAHYQPNAKSDTLEGLYAYSIWELVKEKRLDTRDDLQTCIIVIKQMCEAILDEINSMISAAKSFYNIRNLPSDAETFSCMYDDPAPVFCYKENRDSQPIAHSMLMLRKTIGYIYHLLRFLLMMDLKVAKLVSAEYAQFVCDAIDCVENNKDYFSNPSLAPFTYRLKELKEGRKLPTVLYNSFDAKLKEKVSDYVRKFS